MLKKCSISVFHRQLYCWMKNCFPACVSSIIRATSKSCGKLVFALQFLQGITGVVESTDSCREHLQLSGVPTVVESTHSCPEYLQLSKEPTVVWTTYSCGEHLELLRALSVIQGTSSCREHLQLSRVPPVVESTSSCPKYLQLSRVIFVRLGAYILTLLRPIIISHFKFMTD